MPPAVKGMQQAHRLFLVVGGAALHDRADQHLDQTPADGIQCHRDQKSAKSAWHDIRQDGQPKQSRRRKNMGKYDRYPVPDLIHQAGRDQIHQKLHAEIERDQHRNLSKRDLISLLKSQKQKRYKIIHHRLHDIAGKTGINCFLICIFHLKSPHFDISLILYDKPAPDVRHSMHEMHTYALLYPDTRRYALIHANARQYHADTCRYAPTHADAHCTIPCFYGAISFCKRNRSGRYHAGYLPERFIRAIS